MNPQAKVEKERILAEIEQIIRRLENCSAELHGQRGVGAEECAAALRRDAMRYRRIRNRLRELQ